MELSKKVAQEAPSLPALTVNMMSMETNPPPPGETNSLASPVSRSRLNSGIPYTNPDGSTMHWSMPTLAFETVNGFYSEM